MDYTTLTDEELTQARLDVANEIERRYRLNTVPEQIKDFLLRYHADGGDVYAIQDAMIEQLSPIVGPRPVTDGPEPDPTPVDPVPDPTVDPNTDVETGPTADPTVDPNTPVDDTQPPLDNGGIPG